MEGSLVNVVVAVPFLDNAGVGVGVHPSPGAERASGGPVHRGKVVEERSTGPDGLSGRGAGRRLLLRLRSSTSDSSPARRGRGRARPAPVCRRRRRGSKSSSSVRRRGAVPPARIGLLPLAAACCEASGSPCGEPGRVHHRGRSAADGVERRGKRAIDAEIDGASRRIDVVRVVVRIVRIVSSVARRASRAAGDRGRGRWMLLLVRSSTSTTSSSRSRVQRRAGTGRARRRRWHRQRSSSSSSGLSKPAARRPLLRCRSYRNRVTGRQPHLEQPHALGGRVARSVGRRRPHLVLFFFLLRTTFEKK